MRNLQIRDEFYFAAPVNCSAIRKSDACRTPRASPFFIGITVGRPAPAHSATWSKPSSNALVDGQRAAEAHSAEHAELLPPLQQQPDDLQKILVPADRDAVLGHAAESRHHAVVERFIQIVHVANRPERHALAHAA